MIDAPAKIALQRVSKVIPVGVLHTIGVELSKDVDEPPANRLFVGGSGIDVKIYVVYSPVGMIYVNWLGGDI